MNAYYGNTYRYKPVLIHHGIKGQKWGVRRYQNEDGSLTAAGQRRYDINEAKGAYKQAKKDYKAAQKAARKNLKGTGIFASRAYQKKYDESKGMVNDAEMKKIDARAALAKAKRGEKGEMKAYMKEMRKSGLSGSVRDAQSDNRSTRLYDHITAKKGEQYAQAVETKMKRQLITSVAVGTVAAIGMSVASAYMES